MICSFVNLQDFYKDISEDVDAKFDTSNFPKDHPSGIQGKNKKVPGMMKDEAGGKIIEGFIGGFQPISRDTDDNGEMYKCWWTNKRG